MIQMKRGDTFAFYIALQDDDGEPVILEVGSLKCQVRNNLDQLIAEMDIALTDTAGQYIFRKDDTTTWPLGELYYDIRFLVDGISTSTSTDTIYVSKDVTKDES